MDKVNVTLNGQPVSGEKGTTILQLAKENGIDIPTLCFLEGLSPTGSCRMCVVEVEGARLLSPSCIAQAQSGMKVHTRSPRVERSRRTILEMLASAVDLADAPPIQAMLDDYTADPARFPAALRRDVPLLDDNPMYVRDYSKCVLCWRCVQVCAEDAQYTYAINFTGRGFETMIGTFFDKSLPETTCVFCGQCVGVCPTGALKAKRLWLLEQGVTPDEIIQVTRTERRKRKRD